MPGSRLKEIQTPPGQRRELDCVEVYLPKSIEFLSELYKFLREMVTNLFGEIVLRGFSIYEVDGVFRGEQLWEQRTLVIRLMVPRPQENPDSEVEALVSRLGKEIATRIAAREEEIWICHYPVALRVFRGVKRLLT